MKTVYAATWIEKEIQKFHPKEGADDKRTCTMSESVDIEADSLPKLIKELGRFYALDLDDLFLPGDEDEEVTWFGYNQLETVDSDEPNDDERAAWEAGTLTLWLADYSFGIEKRTVLPIARSEFEAAGIKTH